MFTNLRGNPLFLSDAYNLSHQSFKENTDFEVSHIYNRKCGMILYGFHELITTFLSNIEITHHMISEACDKAKTYNVPFPKEMFTRVVTELAGKIPLKVECLPEGTYCPAGTPFAQISNTVEGFGELVTWWEAIFLHGYFSSSCATEAQKLREYLEQMRVKFKYDESFLLRFHSFGFRGHRSLEDAYWAGSAWALYLHGSDDFHISRHFPDCELTSIPALAHKVVQQFDNEYDCFVRAIDKTAEMGKNIVSLVIDTYDVHNVIRNMIVPLSEHADTVGVHIVLRPDSGDVWKQSVDIYDVVRENELKNVSVIIGEGMSLQAVKDADLFFRKNNVPLNFINYGIGAGYYKHIERDTLGWAMKTAFSNGKPRMKFSENPMKRSTPGRVRIIRDESGEIMVDVASGGKDNEYNVIYEMDKETRKVTVVPIEAMSVIRQRAQKQNVDQLYVKSSPAIKDLIRVFKAKYRQN